MEKDEENRHMTWKKGCLSNGEAQAAESPKDFIHKQGNRRINNVCKIT
jgi:hypothetical protein